MSSPSGTQPAYLEEDLLPNYEKMKLSDTVVSPAGPISMSYLSTLVALDTDVPAASEPVQQETGPAQSAPEDPMGPLEQADRPPSPDSDHESEAGRTILPRPQLDNPEGEPNLHPAPASDISRPVTPYQLPGTTAVEDWAEDEPDSPFGREDEFIPGPHPSVTLKPLNIDPIATEAFRKRVREGISGIDEGKPVPTLDSLMAMVDELVKFESRLGKLEKEVARDRAALAHAMSTTAKSETAASEMRVSLQIEALRQRLDALKTVALPPPSGSRSQGLSPVTAIGPPVGRAFVPRSERL